MVRGGVFAVVWIGCGAPFGVPLSGVVGELMLKPLPSLYEDAAVYDILHAPGTAREFRGLLRLSRRHAAGRATARWLEPACGTGRYLRLAARRGIGVVGIDLDAGMVAYARRRVEAAAVYARERGLGEARGRRRPRIVRGDMERFTREETGGAVTFAFNLINTIRHLSSDRAMLRHFDSVRSVLRPGGVYAVGISLSGYGAEFASEDVWRGVRGRCCVEQVVQFTPPGVEGGVGSRREVVRSHVMVRRPGGVVHSDSTYELRSYSAEEWRELLERAGFEVLETVDHDGAAVRASAVGYGIYVLRPRA